MAADYRFSRGYTSAGPMAPFYVFPCGHSFHAQCLIAHVTRCTNETQVIVCYFFLGTVLGYASAKTLAEMSFSGLVHNVSQTDSSLEHNRCLVG